MIYPADPDDIVGPPEPEPLNTLRLCPHEEFVKLSKKKAGEVLYSVHDIENKRETTVFTTQFPETLMAELGRGQW